MHKIIMLLLMFIYPVICSAGETDTSQPYYYHAEQGADKQAQIDKDAPALNELLAEMNRNTEHTIRLLDKVVSDGCNRQLQQDTIKLVGNMNRNIQIMTNIMVRMGYNIEELSRTPRKMNDLPFMP